MKFHAVITDAEGNLRGNLWSRATSYFCRRCFNGSEFTPCYSGWAKHVLKKPSPLKESNNLQKPQQPEAMEACSQPCDGKMVEEEVRVIPEQNDFVAAVYEEDKQWYIGKVVEVNEEDEGLHNLPG